MANSDITLKNKDELDIYPITRERNVYDENNVNLKTKFESVVFKSDDIYVFAEEEKLKNESMINTNQFKKLASSNVDIEEDYNLIRVTAKGTYAYADYYLDNLEVGETYTIGLDASTLNLSTRPRIFIGSKATASDNSYRTFSLDQTNKHRLSLTFVAQTNILNFTLYINTTTVVENNFIEISKITLAKGNKDIPYVGEIVRTEDVEQKFLKKEYEKTINLFDKNNANILNNLFIYTSGKVGNVAGNKMIYIKCEPNTTYTIQKVQSNRFRVGSYPDIVKVDDQLNNVAYPDSATVVTITTSANDKYLYVQYTNGQDSLTEQEILSSIQIEEGSVKTPYQPYNQISHITNSQAYFLKHEHDKSVNEINIQDSSQTVNEVTAVAKGGAITLNGTPTSTTRLYFNIDVTLDGEYSFNGFKSAAGVSQYVTQGGTTNQTLLQGSSNLTGTSNISFTNYHATQYMIYIPAGTVLNNYEIKPTLVKDNVIPTEFYDWNGYPIHQKDIEPEPLWENATPFSTCEEQTINIPPLTKYIRILVGYKSWKDNKNLYYSIFNTEVGDNYINVIEMTASATNTKVRPIQILSTTSIKIGSAYKNQTLNNSECVPVVIYGLRY